MDEEWATYKKEWASEHPTESPPKTRFEIMNSFLRRKFADETDEMKARCEEYRKTHKLKAPAGEESTRNAEFQM